MKCNNNSGIVQPDNSPLPCDGYFSDECVIHQEAIAYLGLPENSTIKQIIDAMLISLIDARNRIAILEENQDEEL